MTLEQVIRHYELKADKLAIDQATIHYLKAMRAEIEVKDMALADMRAENAELFTHICETGEMVRERSRRK